MWTGPCGPSTDQDGRQPPQVQLLGGQPVGLALGAVVELVLAQLLLAGEGLQAAVQADGLGLRPARLLHAAVLLHDLQGAEAGREGGRRRCSATGL